MKWVSFWVITNGGLLLDPLKEKKEEVTTHAGAKRSKARRKAINQKIVYATLTGNSDAVKRRGNRLTCPATASGRKAPRCRRSFSAIRLNGMMTSRMAFSCTCQPKRKEA